MSNPRTTTGRAAETVFTDERRWIPGEGAAAVEMPLGFKVYLREAIHDGRYRQWVADGGGLLGFFEDWLRREADEETTE